MERIQQLYSDLSRLGRETEMMDTVIHMLADDLMEATVADGNTRQTVLSRVVDGGFELAELIADRLGLPWAAAWESEPEDDIRSRYRRAHLAFFAAAAHLTSLPEDTVLDYRGLQLRPGEVVPQRVAEVVLSHDALGTAWSIEEADPDSVLDALEALIRRLGSTNTVPALVLETEEGDRWDIGTGGQHISGDREEFVQWMAWGDGRALSSSSALPELPRLARWT